MSKGDAENLLTEAVNGGAISNVMDTNKGRHKQKEESVQVCKKNGEKLDGENNAESIRTIAGNTEVSVKLVSDCNDSTTKCDAKDYAKDMSEEDIVLLPRGRPPASLNTSGTDFLYPSVTLSPTSGGSPASGSSPGISQGDPPENAGSPGGDADGLDYSVKSGMADYVYSKAHTLLSPVDIMDHPQRLTKALQKLADEQKAQELRKAKEDTDKGLFYRRTAAPYVHVPIRQNISTITQQFEKLRLHHNEQSNNEDNMDLEDVEDNDPHSPVYV